MRFSTTASQGTSKSESSVCARHASSITMRSGVTTSRTLVCAPLTRRRRRSRRLKISASASRNTAASGSGAASTLRARGVTTAASVCCTRSSTRKAPRARSGSASRRSVLAMCGRLLPIASASSFCE